MDIELKRCPNPECRSTGVVDRLSADTGLRRVHCLDCLMTGPTHDTKAAELWNGLPREPAPWLTMDAEYDVFARRVQTFQAILKASGNAPRAEYGMLRELLRLIHPDLDCVKFPEAADEIAGYLGLRGDPPCFD